MNYKEHRILIKIFSNFLIKILMIVFYLLKKNQQLKNIKIIMDGQKNLFWNL